MLQVYLPGEKWGLFCVRKREEGVLVSSCFLVEDAIQRGMNNNDLHVEEGVFLVKRVASWRGKMRNGLLVW